jgi:hypothetical protein
MQPQTNNSTNSNGTQAPAGYTNQGRGEEIGSNARYLLQLYLMLRTARRNGWAFVVSALRELIATRRGLA